MPGAVEVGGSSRGCGGTGGVFRDLSWAAAVFNTHTQGCNAIDASRAKTFYSDNERKAANQRTEARFESKEARAEKERLFCLGPRTTTTISWVAIF